MNDNLWYFIYTALSLSTISSFVLAYQKKEYRYFYLFSALCVYIIWSETYSEILLQRKQTIIWLINIEQIIEFSIIIIIHAIICKHKLLKKIIFTTAFLYIFFSVYTYLFVISINKTNNINYSIGCIASLLGCFYTIYQIFLSLSETPLQKQPNFIFTMAIIFFYGTTFILQSSYSLLVGLPKDFLNNITTFFFISYASTYFIHTWAFCTQINFKRFFSDFIKLKKS